MSIKTKVPRLSAWITLALIRPVKVSIKRNLHTCLELNLDYFGFEEILKGEHTIWFFLRLIDLNLHLWIDLRR